MTVKKSQLGVLTPKQLPRVYIHGFVPPYNDRPESVETDPDMATRYPTDITQIDEMISSLPPLYEEPELFWNPDKKDPDTGKVVGGYDTIYPRAFKVSGKAQGVAMDTTRTLIESDLSMDLDLSRFVTTVRWETLTTAPYGTATVGLRMPAALTNYLFHGALADNIAARRVDGFSNEGSAAMVDGFRHIQAGGWISIRMPYMYDVDILGQNKNIPEKVDMSAGRQSRAVFFGQILSMTVSYRVNERGTPMSQVALTCGTFTYGLTVSEVRRTVKRVDKIQDIDKAALYPWNDGDHPVVKQLKDASLDPTSIYQVLDTFLRSFAYNKLPTSLAPAVKQKTGGYGRDGRQLTRDIEQRLGDNIGIMGDLVETSFGSIYGANAADINTVRGQPSHYYYAKVFGNPNQSVWQMLQTLFQPNQDLIEFFPVLIPLDEDGSANGVASGFKGLTPSQIKAIEQSSESAEEARRKIEHMTKQGLVARLKAVPYLMYRYKPLPPKFQLTSDNVNAINSGTYRDKVVGPTHHEELHGAGNKGDTDQQDYVYINEQTMISMELTWTEADRINATFFGIPNTNANVADRLLFGVGSVPVFNPEDINRFGLRMYTSDTPFTSEYLSATPPKTRGRMTRAERRRRKAAAEKVKAEVHKFNQLAASASAERLYYLVGEGHAYASGQIRMQYTPNPELLAGIWCKTYFLRHRSTMSLEHGFVAGSGAHSSTSLREQLKPLTFYVTGVSHTVEIDETGAVKGFTDLTIERASYNCRMPRVDLKAVQPQDPPPRPKNGSTKKPKREKTKIKRRR